MRKTSEEKSQRPAQDVGAHSEAGSRSVRRIDQFAQAVDCCIEAKRIADATGEHLLAYLLAMAIQETRSAMRSEVETRAENPVGSCSATVSLHEANGRRKPSRPPDR